MLARRGCIAYANEMLENLQGAELKIYASRFCEEQLPENHYLITTFRSAFSFVWNSLFYLPVLLWKITKNIRQGYQIIYFPTFHHWNPAIILLARIAGAKTILTVHDAVPHPGERPLGQGWFQELAVRWTHRIIVLSDFVKNQLPLAAQDKTSVIPHPVLTSNQQDFSRKLSKQPSLLFLGRIAQYKGIDLLLEAVKDFPKDKIGKLTIAGLSMMKIDLPKTDFPIHLLQKWLSEEELQKLLLEHDVLILPYREASQSGVVTLGTAAVIPMVVTKVGGLPEQLNEAEAIWVEPEPDSIRDGILKLIENSELYKEIHQKLRAKSSKEDNQKIAQQLMDLFQDLQ